MSLEYGREEMALYNGAQASREDLVLLPLGGYEGCSSVVEQ